MLNIGIDFGSTYTMVSVYREDTEKLETIILGTGTPYIPTVVSCEDGNLNGEILFGREAKESADEEDYVVYKAFKMLLSEDDPAVLSGRGYTPEMTPARIAELFLKNLVKKVCNHCGDDTIGCLVIGAPEIWFKGVNTISGRTVLRDICNEIEAVREVQVVSEPAAASAFFAYNYSIITKTPFEGSILLIDYGGGTLDISLSEVTASRDEEDCQLMEIKVSERDGAGENVEGRIGKAGIVYMESVIVEAIRRAGLAGEEDAIPTDNEFYLAVDKLELKIQEGKTKIDDMFEDMGILDLDDLDVRFASIKYRGEKLEITYALLVEVYDRVIRGIFQEKLNNMMRLMREKHGIDCVKTQDPRFKIVLVGGFGNFYLVRKQVRDTFQFSKQDVRQKDIIINQTDCENAISLGTALLSAGLIGIKKTAPYSIGILQFDLEGKCVLDYAFRYKQDIIPDEKYFHMGSDGKPSKFWIADNRIDNMIINYEDSDEGAIVLPFKKEFRKRLQNVVSKGKPIAEIGFSLDSSEILTIWIREFQGSAKSIPLGKFEEMFNTSKLTRVVDL